MRGAKVIAFARQVLDDTAPLASGSHKDSTGYRSKAASWSCHWPTAAPRAPKDASQFKGYQGNAAAPSSVLLQHNGLHLDIQIDRSTPIGQSDAAGVSDLVLEAACPPSSTWKTLWPPWTPRTRCWATATGWASSRPR